MFGDPLRNIQNAIIARLDDSPENRMAKDMWRERAQTVRRARLIASIVTAFCILLIGPIYLAELGPSPGSFFVLASVGYASFRGVEARCVRPRHLLVLLRRFRHLGKKETNFPKALADDAWGLANVVTVQDSSYKGDLPLDVRAFCTVLLPIFSVAASLVVLLYVPLFPHNLTGSDLDFAVTLQLLGVAAIIGLLSYQLLKRRLVYQCSVDNWQDRILGIVKRIRSGRFPHSRTTAVVKLPDATCQVAVQLLLDHADYVVIDLTELSENVGWEIAEALKRLPPEAVTLTWAEDFDSPGARERTASLPENIEASAKSIAGSELIERCEIKAYPNAGMVVHYPFGVALRIAAGATKRKAGIAVASSEVN